MGEMGNIADLAAWIVEKTGDEEKIAVCTRQATPLKYFLYPREIVMQSDEAMQVRWGILDWIWDDSKERFRCLGRERTGRVQKRYPNGDAVIEFTDVAATVKDAVPPLHRPE